MTPAQLNIFPVAYFQRSVSRIVYILLACIPPVFLILFLLPASPVAAQMPVEAENTDHAMTQAFDNRAFDALKAGDSRLYQTPPSNNYNFLISSPNGQDIYAYAINGDGTFGTETLIYEETTAIIYQGFAIADYDRDGDLDFASFDTNGTLYLFKQINPGNFDRSTLFTNTGLKQSGFIATDLNSDGYFDIVGRIGNTQGRIFINHGGNFFLVGNTFSYNNIDMAQGYEGQHQYGAGDFNGDGKTDLAIASYPSAGIGAGDVYILLGNGIGAFLDSPIPVATTPQEGPATITGDFNNDGFYDIISGQDDDGNSGNVGRAWIYFGNGDGTFIDNDFVAYDTYDESDNEDEPGGGRAYPYNLDGDSYLDLIVVYCTGITGSNCNGYDITYWRGDGDGSFTEQLTLSDKTHPYLFSVPPSQGSYLPEYMVWNLKPDCPFCTAGQTEGSGGDPINTRNGNLSFDATDLSISVLGGNLSFRRSYVSGGIDTYTQTLGYGWTHNFDMRLRLTNTHMTGTVELQTPGGNLLPFYIITSTPGVTTYVPYAGVMASLEQITSTYVVTAFNQTTYVFNSQGQLIRQTDAFDNHLYFTYDGQARLQTAYQGERALTYSYDGNGRLATVSDNITRTVDILYDAAGDLVTVTLSAPDDSLILTTIYEYDDHLLTQVIDPSGKTVMETQYDAENQAFKQWDGQGNLLYHADYTLAGTHVITENGVVMTHTYDARGTLIGITYVCDVQIAGCQTGNRQGFDGNFKPGVMRDANGHITQAVWNGGTGGGSNLENVTNALNQTTDFSYDDVNNLAEIENARGYTTSYSYEDTNLPTFRTSTTDALQQTTIYTPTTEGLLEAERDPNGLVTRYWYNEYGQVTQTVRAYGTTDAITMTYGYDAVGRLITTTQVSPDSDPITTLSVYDAANRLIATIQNWTGTNPATWQNDCLTTSGPRDTDICTRYGYDEAGRVISTTNTLGQTDLNFYDDAGRLYLRVSNYDGTANYENDPVGVLCDWVTLDPENNLCSLTSYGYYGRVVSMTNVLGNVDRTFYDSLGRVQATVVNSVNVTDDWEDCNFPPTEADEDLCTFYTYDDAGNVVEVKDSAGRVALTVYDELNRVQGTIVNWDGVIDLDDCYTSTWLNQTERDENVCTRYIYDEVGNTTIVSDTLGRMTYTVYDELNRVQGTIGNWDGTIDLGDCWTGSLPANRDDNVCTSYLYDAAGNQTVVTNTLGQMNLTIYDTAQRPIIQVTNWDGTSTTWPDDCADTASEPDATENLCTFTSYDSLGRRASFTDVMGHVTEFAYDGLGRVITTTRYLDSEPVETTVAYDALGNRLTQTDGEDHTVTTHYDSLNRPVVTISHEGVAITTTYNAASWVLGTVNNLGHTTTNDYDALGRLVVMTDGQNHDTEYGYDALGNQIIMTDALGIETVYGYDDLNRLVSVTENETVNTPDHENNLLTQYVYDVLGNRVVITNALNITTALTIYDELNRPISVKDALGNETQYQYNVLGQRTVMTDANGNITLYNYDELNRLDTVSYETDNETVEYAYDALGNRTTMTDSLGVATYEYDDFSRVITVTSPLTGTVGYRYDRVGNRIELIYPNGYTVTYQYDGDNRQVEVEDWQAGMTTYEYDPVGRLITTTLPNGVVTVNTYDDAHRLTTLTHEDGDSNLVASFTYKLDDVGNRVVATETLRLPFQVMTETQTSPTDLSLTGYQHPAVAYNSEDDEYMVVWQGYDEGSSSWYIYGQRVGTNGALAGDDFEIVAEATEPAIAYSPEQDQYLVVWRNVDDDILGLFVNADGSIPADPFNIYDTDTNSQPDVAYNPNDDTFTVVWLSQNGGKYGIIAYKVQEQGSPVDVAGEEVVLAHPAIAISSNGTQLVVWDRDDSSTGLDIMGQRLNSNGSVLGGVITLADGEFEDDTNPAVAWNNTAGYFLVTWQEVYSSLGDTAYTIEARRVGTDGSLPGYIVTLGGGIDLDASNPDVFYSGNMWFVAWQQEPGISSTDFNLYGRWVQSDGTLADETFDLITASSTQARPALAGGNASGEMLLVWEDDRNSEDAIYHAVLIPGHLETTVIAYTYDPLYRLVEADYSGAISALYEYRYDEVGNMKAYTETVGTELVRVTRSFDDANQLQTSLMLDGPQLGTISYYYDDNGNLEMMILPGTPTVVLSYAYDQRNLLVETARQIGTGPTIPTAQFSYDGMGNRVQQVDLTGSTPITTTYANDNLGLSQVLVAYSGNEQTSNLFGLNLIQQDTGTDILTLLTDGLGSVRLEMVDDIINTATTYDPYGNQLTRAGMGNTIYGFTGEQEDRATGLLYLRARYYNPTLRSFMGRDPFPGPTNMPASQNGYSYTHNNPVNLTDPTGNWVWWGAQTILNEANDLATDIITGAVHRRIQERHNVWGSSQWHAEYLIPGTADWRIDLLHSSFGFIWEIKPRYLEANAVVEVNDYSIAMNAARGNLHGPAPLGGEYFWDHIPNWSPGPFMFSSREYLGTDPSGWVDIYFGQTRRGVIVWWKEKRQTQEVREALGLPDWVVWSEKNWYTSLGTESIPVPIPQPGVRGTPVPPNVPGLPTPHPLPPQPIPTPPITYYGTPTPNNPSCQINDTYSGESALIGAGVTIIIYRLVRLFTSPACGPAAPACAFGP